MQVIGSYAGSLLEWLNTYTFVEEQTFADPAHAAPHRLALLRRADPPRHDHRGRLLLGRIRASVDAFFAEAETAQHADGRRQGDDGPQLPGTRCCDTPQSGYDDTKALIGKWHGRGRAHYAITPRFAITSTHEQMEMAEALAREFPDLPHPDASEREPRRDRLRRLSSSRTMPTMSASTSTTACCGRKTLLGHCIHLSHRETGGDGRDAARWRCSARPRTSSSARACSTRRGCTGRGVRIAVATDIGGGTSYSMLRDAGRGLQGACRCADSGSIRCARSTS